LPHPHFDLDFPTMSQDFDWQFSRHHRRLFLRHHEVLMHIGAHDFEKDAPQRVIFNVDLWVPLSTSTPRHDTLEEVVDYDFVRRIIATLTRQSAIQLQETLCDAVLAALLEHPQVAAAKVSTEKPDVYPDCRAVGVEVFRVKDKFTAAR
jgi:dihydroneopterin aldolase